MNSTKYLNNLDTVSSFSKKALWICATLVICVISLTIIKLWQYPFDCSPDGWIYFFHSFYWCKEYFNLFFAACTIYYTLKTIHFGFIKYIENVKQCFHSTVVIPRTNSYYKKLAQIRNNNVKMFFICNQIGQDIISEISYNHLTITSKDRVEIYFNKYIKKYIPGFECCGYYKSCISREACYGHECRKENDGVEYEYSIIHSIDSFKIIAYDLFCISHEYDGNFYSDITSIYRGAIPKLKQDE
jgi:hypothetical protein